MARLPQPGGDAGDWGQILNDFLGQSLASDGSLKPGVVQASNLAQNAVDDKEPIVMAGTAQQYYRGDKSWQTLNGAAVGLGAVNNTADVDKPISTAVQTALGGKADTSTVGAKILLIDNVAALPPGTPPGVIVVVQS